MTECTAACEVATPNGILYPKHAQQLADCLREVPGTWADILTSARKLDVGASSVGGGGGKASSQEAANLDALGKARTLEVILRGWAEQVSVVSPSYAPPQIAARLYRQQAWIHRQVWAGDLLQELRDALSDCNRATDRTGQRVFAGMCPTEHEDGTTCEQPLYALTGSPTPAAGNASRNGTSPTGGNAPSPQRSTSTAPRPR